MINIISIRKNRQSIVSFLQRFLFKLFNNNLFLCMHVLTNSDFLFNNWSLSVDLIINSFSVKHNLQQSILVALLTIAAISHVIFGIILRSFNCQMYLDNYNSVLFLYLS